jgi:hypothetical protein
MLLRGSLEAGPTDDAVGLVGIEGGLQSHGLLVEEGESVVLCREPGLTLADLGLA